MTTQIAIETIKSLGINQVSEKELKDWFAHRPQFNTTGKEIKKIATDIGIKLIDCDIKIPSFIKINEREMGDLFTKEEIQELYFNKNHTIAEVCKIKKCNKNTFLDYYKYFGFEKKKRPTQKERMTKKDIKTISRLYEKEMFTIHQIAKKFLVADYVIKDVLVENKVKIFKKGAPGNKKRKGDN